jgi:hypothetical protein
MRPGDDMGEPVKVCCVDCGVILTMGKWDCDLGDAVTLGSYAVKKQYKDYREKDRRYRYNQAKEFAMDHTDKEHSVRRVRSQ